MLSLEALTLDKETGCEECRASAEGPLSLILSLWQQEPRKVIIDHLIRLHGSLSIVAQQTLLEGLAHNPVLHACPPRASFVARLLKQLIVEAEDDGLELLDDLVALYTDLLLHPQPVTSWTIKTFYLSQQPSWSELQSLMPQHARLLAAAETALLEGAATNPQVPAAAQPILQGLPESLPSASTPNPSSQQLGQAQQRVLNSRSPLQPPPRACLISLQLSDNLFEGATGCHEWEAGYVCGELIMQQHWHFAGKRVLELGCGSGLVGVLLAAVGAKKVLLTDGNAQALENCRQNLIRNGVQAQVFSTYQEACLSEEQVTCWPMCWDSADVAPGAFDVVVGSDLAYDPLMVPDLVHVLVQLLSPGEVPAAPGTAACTGAVGGAAGTGRGPSKAGGRPPSLELGSIASGQPAHGGVCGREHNEQGCGEGTAAFIVTTLRNPQTMQLFESAAADAGLTLEVLGGGPSCWSEALSACGGSGAPRFQGIRALEDRSRFVVHKVTARRHQLMVQGLDQGCTGLVRVRA